MVKKNRDCYFISIDKSMFGSRKSETMRKEG